MIKGLAVIFGALAVYGMLTAHIGAGLIALFMAGFTLWGGRQLDKREDEARRDPRHARTLPRTSDELEKHGAECWRDQF